MEQYEQLVELVREAGGDAVAFFEQGNKAAGTRLRKAMQEVKTLAQEIRVDVQARKNA